MCHPRSIFYTCSWCFQQKRKISFRIFFSKFRENISTNAKFSGNFFFRNFALRFIIFASFIFANKLVKYKRKILPFFRWMFCSLENLFVPNRLTTYLVCATPDQSSRDGWGPQYMFHSILIFLVKDLSQSPNLLN